jgi:hypothetical protein
LVFAVGAGQQNAGLGSNWPDYDPSFRTPIISQRRRILNQFELKHIDEEPNGRVVIPHDERHEIEIGHWT